MIDDQSLVPPFWGHGNWNIKPHICLLAKSKEDDEKESGEAWSDLSHR